MMSARLHRTLLALSLPALGCGTSLPGQTDENGDECPITEPRGEVTLTAFQNPTLTSLQVVGRFQRSTPARESISCERRTVGACEVSDCRNLGIDFVNGEPRCGSTSAGSLLVTRGAAALQPIEGSALVTLDRPFERGETFTVRTTGADVPAFASTLALPSAATVTGPAELLRGGSLTLRADEGLAVTWSPTTSRVLVIATGNNGGTFTAECAFDGAAGTGTVPSAALPRDTGHVEVWTESRNDLRSGAFPVMVRARWTTGARASISREGN